MLIVISPAKTLDYDSPLPFRKSTSAHFHNYSDKLIEILKKKSASQISHLMKISDNLGELNYRRYHSWKSNPGLGDARQAVLAFMGDVYSGLDARSLSKENMVFAQEHLRILSGLYGVLRPLDSIQPHRLEMGTRLKTSNGKNLYQFWGEKLTLILNKQAKKLKTKYLINLASNEYFKVIDEKKLNPMILTPVFKDQKNGNYKIISFYAKKARGLMARYMIQNQIKNPEDLRKFNSEGYAYNESLSNTGDLVFTREER
tara:strand:- start:838 stop:1611 length:774 start_codon:yes stop_codon:yes gene_type:complete